MNNQIKVYYVDANGVYQGHFRLEKEGYQAKAGETTVDKPSLREPMVVEGGTWRGATDAEYNAWLQAHPQLQTKPTGPSGQEKFNANTTVQLANLMQANQEQKQINANLTLQIAQLLKADQTTDTKTTDTTATTAQAQA